MDPEEGGALEAARAPLVDPQSPGSPFSRLLTTTSRAEDDLYRTASSTEVLRDFGGVFNDQYEFLRSADAEADAAAGSWHSVLLPKFGSGGRLGRGLRCLVLRACRSERKALRRAAADETRAAPTNAGSFLDPLPARRWRRSRADVLPVDADGCTVSRAPIPIISPTLEAYLG